MRLTSCLMSCTVRSILIFFTNLMRRVDINLDFNLVAPATLELQFLPRRFNVDFEDMLVGFADCDGVDWYHFSKDRNQQRVFPRDFG
jgi:hypothetical protein